MKYKEMSIWEYSNPGKDPKIEYHNRFDSPSTLKTGLFINPVLRGERQMELFELFLLIMPKMLELQEKIMRSSSKILELRSVLPGIASDKIFHEYLVNEIINTNDIEGVKTTSKEVTEAISNIRNNSGGNLRLKSFIRMYLEIETGRKPDITTLKDIRDIWDSLLEGEISAEDMPDGELFRNSRVRIGNEYETVHVPKTREEDIANDLMLWIKFINSDVPSLVKAFVAHYFLEYVHPFKDGNGRTGRYIACTYLGSKLDPMSAMTLSRSINRNRGDYYKEFVNVENPKNRGEITFFVLSMMEFLLDGQQRLIGDLEEKKQKLADAWRGIEGYTADSTERKVIYLHFQSWMFNSFEGGLEDRELKKYTRPDGLKNTQVKRCLDKLTDEGVLVKLKKSPIVRSLSDEWVRGNLL